MIRVWRSPRPFHVLTCAAVAGLVATPRATAEVVPFTEEAVSRGVVYVMDQSSFLYGSGCAFADLDGDGDQDLVITGAQDGGVGLFENDGKGQFTDRSDGSGIPALIESSGLVIADYDSDGDLDLYLTQLNFNSVLARNEGDYQFTNVSALAGVANDNGPAQGAAFGDYDGDGRVDLYVCNYGVSNRLYRNEGDGTFSDQAPAQGVDDPGLGYQGVWFDYDLDGDVDLYLSNDRGHLPPSGFEGNKLWRNDGGQLVDVSAVSGTDAHLFSMGVGCADFDANGSPDLYCTNIRCTAEPPTCCTNNCDSVGGVFPLFMNQGNGTFDESAEAAGVDTLDQPQGSTGWGAIFFDHDNDGFLDLYVNIQETHNLLFDCDGTFPCDEVSATAGVQGNLGKSYGSAVGDVDGDGDVDLLINNYGNGLNVELFINHAELQVVPQHWIRYRMVGQDLNGQAIGGRSNTRVSTRWQLREILAGGNSYCGQNELIMHVGLGVATVADEVVATWPGGQTTRTLVNLPGQHTWTLYPPEHLGDAGGDGAVQVDDFMVFLGCHEETFAPGCEVMDFDGDADVDDADFAAFLATYDDPVTDCDENAQPDLLDILENPGLDANANGVLDSCEACKTAADCGDVDGNGLRDDACLWYACNAGRCVAQHRDAGQADMVGFAGACPIDGACDINDKFAAQNCFANKDTQGMPGYPCDDNPPNAINTDAVGFAGSCALDGVCDINDAFASENCFADQGTTGKQPFPCSCDGPAPAHGPAAAEDQHIRHVGQASVRLHGPRAARPGELVSIDVLLDGALPALRGYQVHLGVAGGVRGTLELVDIAIDSSRADYVFASAPAPAWTAFNVQTQQMLAAVSPGPVPLSGTAYLATFTYRVPADAAGTFVIDLRYNAGRTTAQERTFVFASPTRPVLILDAPGAAVEVLGLRR